MKRASLRRAFLLAFLIPILGGSSNAARPTWAKKATSFPEECRYGQFKLCRPKRIPAPDGKSAVFVTYEESRFGKQKGEVNLFASLKVKTPDGRLLDAQLPYGFQDVDLLWAPDSKAFFIDGGGGSAIAGFWFYVIRVNDQTLNLIDLSKALQRDMVETFRPCEDSTLGKMFCGELEQHPEYNVSGIDWIGDSSRVLVIAQIPCSSMFGTNMCQMMGYEVEVSSGKIFKRFTAKQLKREWQRSVAWNIETQ